MARTTPILTRAILVAHGLALTGCATRSDTHATTDGAANTDGAADTDGATDTDGDADTDDAVDTDAVVDPGQCVSYRAPRAGPVRPLAAGSFRVERILDGYPDGILIQDLDLDGHMDLAVLIAQTAPAQIVIRYGTAAPGVFDSVTIELPHARRNHILIPFDLDVDGDADLLYGTEDDVIAVTAAGRAWTVGATVVQGNSPAVPEGRPRAVDIIQPFDLDGVPPLDLVVGRDGALLGECIPDNDGDTGSARAHPTDSIPAWAACFVGSTDHAWVPATRCPEPMLRVPATATYAAFVSDIDDDGDGDLFLANDFSENRLLLRGPDGLDDADRFAGLNDYNHAMGTTYADFDGDGRRDWFITDTGTNHLFRSGGCVQWFDGVLGTAIATATRDSVTWAAHAVDLDLNGAPDILTGRSLESSVPNFTGALCGGAPFTEAAPGSLLFLNDGTGQFTTQVIHADEEPEWRGYFGEVWTVVGDLDGDQDPDIVTGDRHQTAILWNDIRPASSVKPSVRVHVVDAHGQPVLGARVVLRQVGGSQRIDLWPTSGLAGWSELVAEFGVAPGATPKAIDVRFPDGVWRRQLITGPGTYTIRE